MLRIKKKELIKIIIGMLLIITVWGIIIYHENKVAAKEDRVTMEKVIPNKIIQTAKPVIKTIMKEDNEDIIEKNDVESEESASEVATEEVNIESDSQTGEVDYSENEKNNCWNAGGIWDESVGYYWPTPAPEQVMPPQIAEEDTPTAVVQEMYGTPVQENNSIEQGCTIVEAPSDGWITGGSGYLDYNQAWALAQSYTDDAAIQGTLLRFSVDPVYDSCGQLAYYRWLYKAQ